MRIQAGSASLVAALVVAGVSAGGSFARPYVDRGDATKSQVSSGGSQGQTAGTGANSAVDPNGSVKHGKGVRLAEVGKETCPASPKKPAKHGKGIELG